MAAQIPANDGDGTHTIASEPDLVVIIDDSPEDREAIMHGLRRLPDARYNFREAGDGPSGIALIGSVKPAIVLLDYFLPGHNGLEVLVAIRHQYPTIAVILLTGHGDELVAAKGIKAGASDYFDKASWSALRSAGEGELTEVRRLHEAMQTAIAERRARHASRGTRHEIHALIVDDNPDDREACIRALRRVEEMRYVFAEVTDGKSALAAIEDNPPDVLLLDYSLPGDNGLQVLLKIRDTKRYLPVIMLTGQGNEALAVRGIKSGAADYISKGALTGALLHRSILAAIEHHRSLQTIEFQSRMIQQERERVEDSNHFLHNLLDHIPDPILVKSSRHQWLMANEAFRELVGASGSALTDSGRSVLPVESAEEFWAEDERALKGDEACTSEQRIADKAGDRRLFSIKRATFRDRLGDKVMVGVMRDITAQRESEDEFKLQAAQLMSQSQDLASLGAILEESLQEILLVDERTLLIMQANKGAQRNLSYTQPELERLRALDLLANFTEEQFRKVMTPLETGEQLEVVFHAAFRRKNGSLYEVEVHTQRAVSRGRKVFVQIVLDETERKRVERMKSEFISKVSHELRTPVTSILGALGLLSAGALDSFPEKAAGMVRIAHSNAERLSRLVNDILALEKSVSGNLSLDSEEVPVNELLRQAVESHTQYAEKYKVRLVLDVAERELSVVGDAGRLMQVLANLLSNAAKFSPAGGAVTLRARAHGASIRFEVEDSGCGIPETFRPRIFETFAQADSSTTRRYEGSGLGLAITKQLIEAMDGTIWFESEMDRGSTFFFELPQPRVKPRTVGTPEKALRVLICSDDARLALIIRLALEQDGLEAVTVGSRRKGREAMVAMPFALVALDLGCEEGSGAEFLEGMDIPVIAVSAGNEQDVTGFRNDPRVADWVSKPLDQNALVEAVRKALLGVPRQPSLLYVGGDSRMEGQLAERLGSRVRLVMAHTLSDCYRELRARRFDFVMVDPRLTGAGRRELLDHVGAGAEASPHILLLAESDIAPDGGPQPGIALEVLEKLAVSRSQELEMKQQQHR